jgi:cytochrome c biogenesis protein CcdA
MTSLTDVYDGGVGSVASQRRRMLGTAVFAAGAAMVVGAIPIATTDLGSLLGYDVYGARRLAGILAGLGIPAVFVGIFTVLPASRVTRAAAAIGASLAVFAVTIFGYAYPYQWISNDPTLAVVTTLLYSAGALVTFWCLFVGVATFKRRKNPGGTARLEITEEGTVRVVRQDESRSPLGGIGLFGRQPDGEVETQTNEKEEVEDETIVPEPSADSSNPGVSSQTETMRSNSRPASDGAGSLQTRDRPTGDQNLAPPSDEVQTAVEQRGRPDSYCGNCAHFEYVRSDGEITPYCGFHGDLMDDMDACDQWEPNS